MPNVATKKVYDARIDAKKRLTIRGADYASYRVEHHKDGSILLKPLVPLDQTPAGRKRRLDDMITKAKAKGEKVPAGVKHIVFRDITPAQKAFAKTLEPIAAAIRARRSKAAA